MHHKFYELTKSLAQSVTRRAALKKLGAGLAGMAFAAFGLVSKAEGNTPRGDHVTDLCHCKKCHTSLPSDDPNWWTCESACRLACGGR